MRFLALLVAAGVALVSAQKPSIEQLAELAAANNGVIRLDGPTYDLLTSPKRTWSASIQFTALDKKRACHPCKDFDPSWNEVAAAWAKVDAEQKDQHFFATLDFDHAPNVFQKLGIATAPVVFIYPPVEGPRKAARPVPMKYDFSEGFDAAPLAEQLSKFTPVPIPYTKPIDWAKWITTTIAVLGAGALIKYVAPVALSRWTWAIVSVVSSLIMTGGYMFTRIRNSPYVARDGNWIAPGFTNQFGQEVHVIAFIYGLLALSFLMLTLVVPRQTSPAKQRLQVWIWSGVIMIVYSVLVSIFRVKNRGYPFKLFL
ncbi:dolichyl-diphosphooligosaccharide-protein glycotransferase [Coprinopsis cinerea okayama7|uniref:Dolichyl-diphosphooligosaccharide-protein glycotransferase n=1 Tax=Coprinopsis cinerea (strain Okayama-7 / 130 / ATCC MYA-4618 / FGSC 9003) TaxID=240176 RepID=A8NFD1_COPC7|nr:dolichyl-diphosphooligosaccharide-protein glycotransferase [Coprinopsis cinerea okayama7\|eukprot:XP_001833254.1 dolichyl-diphosphooligosaccharide-protein glycotransferase [Coprinopsis cinerea okayama7\